MTIAAWEKCPGGDLEPVPSYPGSTRVWWRCPTCRWVGWFSKADRPPADLNPSHRRPTRRPM